MKHISEFLVLRMRSLEKSGQLRLFEAPREKGSSEWETFNPVSGDVLHAYHVKAPQKAITIRGENHVLRIVYPPTYAPHAA